MTDDTQHDQPTPTPDDGSTAPEAESLPQAAESGSRWEPAAAPEAADTADTAPAPPYVSASLSDPPLPAAPPRAPRSGRGRLALIGVAAAAAGLVVGGASGFALGHATGDDERGNLSFERGEFPGDHHERGFPPPGAPGQGDEQAPSTDGDDGADT